MFLGQIPFLSLLPFQVEKKGRAHSFCVAIPSMQNGWSPKLIFNPAAPNESIHPLCLMQYESRNGI